MMSDKESQADEVQALQSIFSEEEFSSTNEDGVFCLQFYAFITLPEDFKIVFRNLNESENGTANEQTIKVHYLPPIEMYIKLPQDYPSVSPPLFQLCCSWLSYEMLEKLCKELDRLWVENKGSEILFIWTQFLKEECLNFLGITDKLDLSGKYTRESEQIKNNLRKRNSSTFNNSLEEQDTPVGNVSNNAAADISDIEKRLPDSVVAGSTVEKCDSDAVCSGKAAQEAISDYSKNKNFRSRGNNRRQYNNYSSEKHSNSESDRVYHTNSRRQRYEKRIPNYDKKKENESFDRSGSGYDRRKFPFEKRLSGVTSKPFNSDTNKCETTTVSSSSSASSNQTENSHQMRKVLYDKNRKFRSDNVVSNDSYNNTKTYYTTEFVNSKYTSYPHRRFRYASKTGSKTTFEVCKQKKNEKETTENKIYNKVVSDESSSNFSNESQVNMSSAVSNVNHSSSTEVPNSCSQESNTKLSSLSVYNNTCTTSVSSCSTNAGKSLHKSGLRRVYDRRIRRPKQHKKHLHEVIEDYDRERSKTEFGRNIFTCNICFANKLGVMCTQFKPCDHVFCRECISGYIEVRIQEGTVQSINCPEHKCESEAIPSQIRELVSPELFARYDSILLSSTLDTMGDIVYCPRTSCQYPVSKEEGEKMAMCPACKYVFCIYCKMVYHGVEPCRLKNEEKLALVKEYRNADKETKLRLEQRYGKSLLTSLVENHMSETWISNNSQSCPNCNAAIEKSDGCNKMVCWKCNTFFCWLCGTRLDPLAPYKHYYDTKSRCNNRLFEGLMVEGNDSDNEENVPFDNEEHDAVAFEMGYNMFVINLQLDPELENHLLVRIDNVD